MNALAQLPSQHVSPVSTEPILASLNQISVPTDHESHALYDRYCYQVTTQPTTSFLPSCIVCGEAHRFVKCKVLLDTDFLRSHYIRYCQFLKRDENLQKKQQALQVHFLDSPPAVDEQHDSPSDTDDDEPVFRHGSA